MKTHPLSLHAVVVAITLLSSGCASIISGRTATVNIDSRPSDAEVVIHDKHGNEVLTTHTPASVELRRKDGWVWPAKYTATIEKPGYQPRTVPIHSTLNPWVLGNIVIGGPIGLVVDTATGAGWKPKVASIEPNLEPIYTAQQPAGPPVASPDANQRVEPATAVY
jgi:hypothetical protein